MATSDGGSDLHQVYLTWLCDVRGFSQPLDVSFRPHLSSLISCRYHLGFHLQSFPSVIASCVLRLTLPLLTLPVRRFHAVPLVSRDSCTHRVRTCLTGVTRCQVAVPLLVFAPPRFSSLSLGSLSGASSHGLRHAALCPLARPSFVMPALQSFKELRVVVLFRG